MKSYVLYNAKNLSGIKDCADKLNANIFLVNRFPYDANSLFVFYRGETGNVIPATEIEIEGYGNIILVPENQSGLEKISELIYKIGLSVKNQNPHAISMDSVSDFFRESKDIIVTSGWDNGILCNILFQNIVLESKAEPYLKTYRLTKDDANTYETAIKEKEELGNLHFLRHGENDPDRAKQNTYASRDVHAHFYQDTDKLITDAKKRIEVLEKTIAATKQAHKINLQAKAKYKKIINGKKDTGSLYEAALKITEQLNELFPKFFIEINSGRLEEQAVLIPVLSKIAEELDINTVFFKNNIEEKEGKLHVRNDNIDFSLIAQADDNLLGTHVLSEQFIISDTISLLCHNDHLYNLVTSQLKEEEFDIANKTVILSREDSVNIKDALFDQYKEEHFCVTKADKNTSVLFLSEKACVGRHVAAVYNGSHFEFKNILGDSTDISSLRIQESKLLDVCKLCRCEHVGGIQTDNIDFNNEISVLFPNETEKITKYAQQLFTDYPIDFLCAMFNCVEKHFYGVIADLCAKVNIQTLSPDINISDYGFSVESAADSFNVYYVIRTGLKAISAKYKQAMKNILKEREQNGIFVSIQDFFIRTAQKKVSRNNNLWELMPQKLFSDIVKSGALDMFGYSRRSVLTAFSKGSRAVSFNGFKTKIEQIQIDSDKNALADIRGMSHETLMFIPSNEISAQQDMDNKEDIILYGVLISFKKDNLTKRSMHIRMANKTDIYTVFVVGETYDKYARDMKQFLYEDIKIYAVKNENGIFLKSISFFVTEKKEMLIKYISRNDITALKKLGKEQINNPENPVRVGILSWETQNKNLMEGPIFYHFSEEAIQECIKRGIPFIDQNKSIS